MTPELPRAPRSKAEAAVSAAAPIPAGAFFRSASAAAPTVRLILVPVSPSGTGNTLSSLICCRFCFRAAEAQTSISVYAAPSMNSLKAYAPPRAARRPEAVIPLSGGSGEAGGAQSVSMESMNTSTRLTGTPVAAASLLLTSFRMLPESVTRFTP